MSDKWKVNGQELDYKVLGSFTCPFCSKMVEAIAFSKDPPDVVSHGMPAVIHTKPTCLSFDLSEPEEFVSLALKKRLGALGYHGPGRPSPKN